MKTRNTRRIFLGDLCKTGAGIGLVTGFSPLFFSCGGSGETGNTDADSTTANTVNEAETGPKPLFFTISLAQWSLHKTIFKGDLDNLGFPLKAKKDFDIHAVEYVNQFFKDKAKDQAYLADLKGRTDGEGIKNVLIMIDGEGNLGDADDAKRIQAVENHYKWVEAAKFLGCHSIRVNAGGQGTAEEVAARATEGLTKLSVFAKDHNINVIVENHGSHSSNGKWLAGVIAATGMDNCGTLPDFGNFCIQRSKPEANNIEAWMKTVCLEEYDRYLGMEELMPYAKGVSAKAYAFDANGDCVETDYMRVMKTVKDAGYTGHIGIEYEGPELSEDEGIKATKRLLEKTGAALA